MKSFSTGCIAALSIALLVSACGGANVSESAFDEPGPDAGGVTIGADASDATDPGPSKEDVGVNPKKDTGAEPVVDAPSPPDTTAPLSAENVCPRLADAVCTPSLATCCASKGIEYKDSGCKAAIFKNCTDKQAAVKAGDTTLNLDAYNACVSAWSSLSAKCATPLLEFIKVYPPCNQLFNGTTAPGGSCSQDYECKVAPGALASCTRDGRCDSLFVAATGAPCGAVMGSRVYCDYGLYCQYTSSTSGTCRTARALGSPCSQSYECGLGNYCSRSGGGAGSCVVGIAAGGACSFNEQCASASCVSGRCADPNVSVASAGVCNGSGG